MPLRFPWKKKKTGTRISQMVKDQFHRRKNAASPLVVETGFPTSIVDLIVNHRDRFRKPSSPSIRSKKNNPPPPPPPPLIDDPDFVSPPQSPPPSTSLTSPALLILPPGIAVPITGEQESGAPSHSGESPPQDIVIQGEDGICNTVKPNRVLVVVLMIFLMVVLALGTKKFALGITVSAFLLFFLEYLGKNVPWFFTPYSKAKERLRPIVMGAWSFVSSKMARLEEEEEEEEEDCVFKAPLVESVSPPVCSFGESDGKSNVIQEIEIEELEEVEYRNERSYEKSFFDRKLKREGDLEVRMQKETEVRSEFSEFKIGESHKAKIKSKMKIVVAKKFRSLRKKLKDLETELTPTGDGNFSVLEEKEYHQELEFEHESKLNGIVNVRDACDAISSSGELIDGLVETIVVAKDNSIEKEDNSGYMVLFLIALLGLVGGRVFALLFILAWCFLSRSREAIRRCLKVPTVRSFINV